MYFIEEDYYCLACFLYKASYHMHTQSNNITRKTYQSEKLQAKFQKCIESIETSKASFLIF